MQTLFSRLDKLLHQNAALWQFRPFYVREFPWQHSHAALCDYLTALSDDAMQALLNDENKSQALLKEHIPALDALAPLLDLPRLEPDAPLAAPVWFSNGIKGRKWQQITHFGSKLAPPAGRLVEWCAGKGHLGRLLGRQHHTQVCSLEYQPELCEQGTALAKAHGVDQQFIRCDVLAPLLPVGFAPQDTVVALHACGDLHLRLLQQAAEELPAQVLLSPCCYHKTRDQRYRPLSDAASASPLRLCRADLAIAVQESVTAGQRERRQRSEEQWRRILFDVLLRDYLGVTHYVPVPSAPKSLIRGELDAFFAWAAAKSGLVIPKTYHLPRLEAQARRRQHQIWGMELVQRSFRRALELWLVADRAMYLAAKGYRVDVGTFCHPSVTPRNILLRAWR